VQPQAPVALLVSTVLCIVVVNLLLAQAITQTFYPGAGLRIGPAVFGALGVAAFGGACYVVIGWRSYLKHQSKRPVDE
jgi:hypothetical protein